MKTVKELNEFLNTSKNTKVYIRFYRVLADTGDPLFVGGFDFDKNVKRLIFSDQKTLPSWMDDLRVWHIQSLKEFDDRLLVHVILPENVFYKDVDRALNLEFFEIPKTIYEYGRAAFENKETDVLRSKVRELTDEHDELVKIVVEKLKQE